MRKVRHKNVVQFIGACTRKPNLCIVFEFMSGGSVYDYIRRVCAGSGLLVLILLQLLSCCASLLQEGPLRLSQVLRIATEVSRGMDYLHQRKIIHRDLKAANLLMDDHSIVKVPLLQPACTHWFGLTSILPPLYTRLLTLALPGS